MKTGLVKGIISLKQLMRNFAKLLSPLMCLVVFFSTTAVSVEAKEDNIIEKKEDAIKKITQAGIVSIDTNQKDRSSLSSNFLNFETIKEMDKKIQDKQTATNNEKRLAYYESRLNAYKPPEEEMNILVTGYSSTPDQTWGDPFTTASGTRVHLGTMACPPQYPFGTKISIEDRGTYVCEDRGGAIKGNHFDMWFQSRGEALHWGKRVVAARIEK